MPEEQHERDSIRRADEHLTRHDGVVVDDAVLQRWGDGDSDAVLMELLTATESAGGVADYSELRPVAPCIASPGTEPAPWLSPAESRGVVPPAASPSRRAARLLAGELLGRLDGGRRWRHTQAVAARAAQAIPLLARGDADRLMAAAWLHDVGYAPRLERRGFHPVDGAEHVSLRLSDPFVAGLIAHHSGARFIAESRGLGHLMTPYADPTFWTGPIADALTWADQTTGPDGEQVTIEERMEEMLHRHGPGSPNARVHHLRGPALRAAVDATERRLDGLVLEAGASDLRSRIAEPQN